MTGQQNQEQDWQYIVFHYQHIKLINAYRKNCYQMDHFKTACPKRLKFMITTVVTTHKQATIAWNIQVVKEQHTESPLRLCPNCQQRCLSWSSLIHRTRFPAATRAKRAPERSQRIPPRNDQPGNSFKSTIATILQPWSRSGSWSCARGRGAAEAAPRLPPAPAPPATPCGCPPPRGAPPTRTDRPPPPRLEATGEARAAGRRGGEEEETAVAPWRVPADGFSLRLPRTAQGGVVVWTCRSKRGSKNPKRLRHGGLINQKPWIMWAWMMERSGGDLDRLPNTNFLFRSSKTRNLLPFGRGRRVVNNGRFGVHSVR
jgi:hypothetical protein